MTMILPGSLECLQILFFRSFLCGFGNQYTLFSGISAVSPPWPVSKFRCKYPLILRKTLLVRSTRELSPNKRYGWDGNFWYRAEDAKIQCSEMKMIVCYEVERYSKGTLRRLGGSRALCVPLTSGAAVKGTLG